MNDCIFCKIITGAIPSDIVAQNDDVIVVKDINPKAPIHYLIIPKNHTRDLRDAPAEKLGSQIFAMAQQLSRECNNCDFRLVMSNGFDAGQRVFHTHVHFLAGSQFIE